MGEGSEGPERPEGLKGFEGAEGAEGAEAAERAEQVGRAKCAEEAAGTEGAGRVGRVGGAEKEDAPQGPQGPQGPRGSRGAAGARRAEISLPNTERQTLFSWVGLSAVVAAQSSPSTPGCFTDIGIPLLTVACQAPRYPLSLRATPSNTGRASTSGRQLHSARSAKTERGDAPDNPDRDGVTTLHRVYTCPRPPRSSRVVPYRCVSEEEVRSGLGDRIFDKIEPDSREEQDIDGVSSGSCSCVNRKGSDARGGGGGGDVGSDCGGVCNRETATHNSKEV